MSKDFDEAKDLPNSQVEKLVAVVKSEAYEAGRKTGRIEEKEDSTMKQTILDVNKERLVIHIDGIHYMTIPVAEHDTKITLPKKPVVRGE